MLFMIFQVIFFRITVFSKNSEPAGDRQTFPSAEVFQLRFQAGDGHVPRQIPPLRQVRPRFISRPGSACTRRDMPRSHLLPTAEKSPKNRFRSVSIPGDPVHPDPAGRETEPVRRRTADTLPSGDCEAVPAADVRSGYDFATILNAKSGFWRVFAGFLAVWTGS